MNRERPGGKPGPLEPGDPAGHEFGSAPSGLRNGLLARSHHVIGLAAAALLVAMVLLTTVDVVGRYFFGQPLQGAFELTEMAMGAMVFASLPLVTLRRQHVTVDLLASALPRRWRRLQAALVDLVVAGCSAAVAWQLVRKAERLAEAHETTATLAIPVYPLVWVMAALALVAALATLVLAWLDLRGIAPATRGVQ